AAPAVQPAVAYKSVETKDLNVSIADKGYTGNLKKAMKLDDFKTANLEGFLGNGNPFMVGQCTWFAWARFYQVYGFDSGARGNGKTNAREIVAAHGDKFELSSTPAAGATFSMEKNTLYPQYGHVGFIEAFDGEFIWVSEGNVMFNDRGGNIWVHKVRWADFKASYPDVVFAIPKKGVCDLEDPQEPAQRTIRLKTKKTEKDPGEKTEKTVRRIVLKRPAKAAE
ncbi:CHAP domain-containing protein, partial [uncultured Dubosiella sp.]